MKNNIKIIFDLDGTLFDSLADLKNSLNSVLARYNLPQHSSADYRQFVGNGMKVLVERALPKDHPQFEAILSDFLDEYGKRYYEESRPYAGVIEMLKALNEKEIAISICTNKNQVYTDDIVKRFFSDIKFAEVVGNRLDGLNKPNPHYPLLMAKAHNLDSKDVYFIGDSDVDIQTANNAEMKAIGVSWGFRSVAELNEAGAIMILDRVEDVYKLL